MTLKALGARALIMIFATSLLAWTGEAQQTQESQSSVPAVTHKMTKSEKKKTAAAKGAMIDINSANKEELAALPGMNPDFAQKIVDGRPYRQKTDLVRKKILPQNTYNAVRDQVIAKQQKK